MPVYNWSELSIDNITSLYLYGNLTKPNLINDALIRQNVSANDVSKFADGTPLPTVELDEVSFMTTGPGRFAKASESRLVDFFFNNSLFPSTGHHQEFSLSEALDKLGFTKFSQYSIAFHQFEYEAGSKDFLQRSYIYDQSSFIITDKYLPADHKTKFIIEADGTKHIQNMQLLALNDDFDFTTLTSSVSQYANDALRPSIDPSNIGRKIIFTFNDTSKAKAPLTGEINAITGEHEYYLSNYLADKAKTAGPIDYAAGVTKLGLLKNTLIESLWSSKLEEGHFGVTKFLDSTGRPIIYGGNGNNGLDAVNLKWDTMYPKLAPFKNNGVVLFGGKGYDSLIGTDHKDDLYGGDDNDGLSGLAGVDKLVGGKGNDSLVGGSGNDKFVINNGDGWDTIYDRQQGDRIIFNGTELTGTATYKGNGEYSLLGYKIWQHGYSLEITSPDGKTSMEAQQFFTTSNGVYFDTTNMGITVPGIYQPTGIPKIIIGTEKDDVFNLVGGPNTVNALGGNDTIGGASIVDGGAGNDYIRGTSATDVLNGGTGDDVILSEGGLDTIHGGPGNDLIYSGGGGQKIFGDAGFDTVDYASSMSGVEVNLALTTPQEGWTYNYAYDDILSGIEGISGTGWADTLIGDSGNNLLIGRGGADTLTGGAGADVFKYNHPTSSGGDIGPTASTSDVITDFANGVDKLDLSDFAGTFVFMGTGAFNGIAHEVNYSKVAGNTFIGLDIDGNKTLDAQIELLGLHTMTAIDFML